MGLDMYLTKDIYLGAKHTHNQITGTVEIFSKKEPVAVNLNKICSIIEEVGYWRKSNQTHQWFVNNVQEGVDDCGTYSVNYKQLIILKDLCTTVLATKDASLLPPSPGFFFGSTEIDVFYWQDLQETISIISALDPRGDYYYRSSW